MGQKVHPIGFRVGVNRGWDSRWFADKEYTRYLHEDLAIRRFLKKELYQAQISRIVVERAANKAKVFVYSARPGMIIGRRCASLEKYKTALRKVAKSEVFLNIIEVRKVEADAQLVAESVAAQLVKRVSYRRAMKKALQASMRQPEVKGMKIHCAGRLGGAEMSRSERYHRGRVPLHTLRADIDYGFALARTTYGVIGVKVWLYKGDLLTDEAPATNQ